MATVRLLTGCVAISLLAAAAAARLDARQAAPSAAGQQAAPRSPATVIENGRTLYAKYGCAGCHGLEGQGAPTTGPRLGPDPLPIDAFVRFVRRPPNQMPPYTEKVLPEQDLRDIQAFLAARPRPTRTAVPD
jgi:mono/diheme cytochrome c family protein